ncbi:MAG TPA: site-2 protease family protein [Candidatus Binatia bacterium]|nr:site-2 protease family protein [Candidatus Binatia bacterium]
MAETIQQIAFWAVPVLVAIIFHEVAHGWVAYRLGDDTAKRMGRLTLNPISHIDLFGTILMPGFLIVVGAPFVFGYAKPVPVNFQNLHRPKRDMIWVAGAGPVTNILLAAASLYLLLLIQKSAGLAPDGVAVPLGRMAQYSVSINVMLAAFNLLPLPPLDGGRVMVGLLPNPYSSIVAHAEPYGFLIILLLLMTHTLDFFMEPFVYFIAQLLKALVIGQ